MGKLYRRTNPPLGPLPCMIYTIFFPDNESFEMSDIEFNEEMDTVEDVDSVDIPDNALKVCEWWDGSISWWEVCDA